MNLLVITFLFILEINAQIGNTNPDLNKCNPSMPLAPPYGTSYFDPSNPTQISILKQHSESLDGGSLKNCNWDVSLCCTTELSVNKTMAEGWKRL